MATKLSGDTLEINVLPVQTETIHFCILGKTPLICNRMSQKAQRTVLFPDRKTVSEKASSLKHDPIAEFRASPYTLSDVGAPTKIAVMATSFKKAMGTAAIDNGAKKAQIGRLVYIEGELLPIYGIPEVHMAVVRLADIGKTADVRTRAILREWACYLSVTYTKPMLRQSSVVNLLAAAGIQSGIGDWRQEKGSGSFGAFELVAPDHPDFVRITTTMGRDAQVDAMNTPVAYDDETSEMLQWFSAEVARKGFKVAA